MQPPPLAVIAHGKLSFQMYFKFSRRSLISNLFSRYATPAARPFQPAHLLRFLLHSPGGWCVFLLFEANETRMPRLRNFDTEPHSPYCYEGYSDNRLESVANAHTAADLHVRPVSKTALVQEPWAPRTLLDVHHALFPATEMIRVTWRENRLRPRQIRQCVLQSTTRF